MSNILQNFNIQSSWAGGKVMTPESEAGESTRTNHNSRTDPFTRTRRPWLARTGAGGAAFVLALAVTSAAVAVSCSHLSPRDSVGKQRTGQAGGLAQIDLAKVHQTIVGFGSSSGWTSPTMDDSQADAFFTVDKGIGLSLLRIRIAPNGTSLELATAKQAIAYSVSVWAAPWSPPAEWKDNHDVNNGGHLLPEHRQDWADRLVSFAKNAAAEGVPLIGLSAQNEPG